MAATKRTRAPAMVRSLYAEAARNRPGRPLAWWCPISLIVKQADDVDVLAYAVAEKWIEVSPGAHSVRLLDAGRDLVE